MQITSKFHYLQFARIGKSLRVVFVLVLLFLSFKMFNADMRDSFHLFERCDLDEDILRSDVLTVFPGHRNMP